MIVGPNDELGSWTIYQRPLDYPDKYVARLYMLDKPTGRLFIADTLEAVRAAVLDAYPELFCIARQPNDHPSVIEVWL